MNEWHTIALYNLPNCFLTLNLFAINIYQ
ncbi:unnamed protein product [Acanthoscelides obtectus]|uniref:Uncharacterized protein n=1 Tax=Acanthoscelides obtectus TaxID=200917 RepID=A0A9P0PQT2_ACAOB|nr:unnamed protein product [Acanthoscelides obtectus]CAK1624534.1 hypothetical protein AOBTE_LOCUS2593 [Acanthoscelides obtectus]